MTKRELLRKLQTVRTTEHGIVPDPEFVVRNRALLMSKVRKTLPTVAIATPSRTKTAMQLVPQRMVNFVRAPAMAIASVLLTVMGGSVFSVSASERSIPGDFLYPIKIATEQTRLALTSDKAEKLKLKSTFVDRRVQEIKTLSAATAPDSPVLVKQTAEALKRDLNTVKTQLSEVKSESGSAAAAEAAKIVDKQSEQVVSDLKQLKEDAPSDTKNSLTEAEVAAVHTGVKAVEVMIDTKDAPNSHISDDDVRQSITNKVQGIQSSIVDSTGKLQGTATGTASAILGGMTSSTVDQLKTASSSLQEARVLLNENKFSEVSGKLLEAAKASAQAEVSADQFIASSTQAILNASSTTVIAPTTSSTLPTASTSSTSATSTSATKTSTSTKATSTSTTP